MIRTVATGLARPQRMAWVGPTLLVADSDSHRVVEVDPLDGTVVPLVGTGAPGFSGDGGPASEATLDTPLGVGVAEDGTLYIADSENHVIRSVGPNGTIQTVAGVGTPVEGEDAGVAIEVGLRRPFDVTVGPEGRVWISDTLNSRVRVLTP